jgi:cell division septal protein FtsQ
MFWTKKRKKDESPKERDLFREAFLPPKKAPLPKQPSRTSVKRRFPGVVLLWGLLLATVTYALFSSPFHSVTDVSVSGTVDVPSDRVETFLRDLIGGKRVLIFPKDNFFLLSSDDMERSLLESFPKIRRAEVGKRFPDRMQAVVEERDRIPLWCVSGTCFLLDDDGVAHDARFAEQPENDPFLIRIEDSGGVGASVGDRVLDREVLSKVIRLERGIRDSGIVAISPRAVTPSRVSGEFRFTTTDGWDILVSTDPDPETTLASLRVVLEKEIPEERREKLRYIDLRAEKKAFYSFIPDEPDPAEETKDEDSDSENKRPKDEKKKLDE